MKSPTPCVFLVVSLLSCSLWAQQQKPALTINYDPATAFKYPEGEVLQEINRKTGYYNNELKSELQTAHSAVDTERDPATREKRQVRVDEISRERAAIKSEVSELKSQLAEERSRLATAKATRANLGMPECAQLPWGASQKTVNDLMAKKGAKPIGEAKAQLLTFKGGSFAGVEVNRWECKFTNGKLFNVVVYITRFQESLELFREWNATIAKKYFIAEAFQDIDTSRMAGRKFTDKGYDVEDAQYVNNLLLGKIRPTLQWGFSAQSSIQLILANTDTVAIGYINGVLDAESEKTQQKAKEANQKDL